MPHEREILEVQDSENDGKDFPGVEGAQIDDESMQLGPADLEHHTLCGSHVDLVTKEVQKRMRTDLCRCELWANYIVACWKTQKKFRRISKVRASSDSSYEKPGE